MLINLCMLASTVGASSTCAATYTCASLLRLKSIVGCSRSTRLGKIPALQCV